MAVGTGGGAAAPYKARRRRKLKKLALGKPRVPKPQPRQIGGGIAAPGPLTIPPFPGRARVKPRRRYVGQTKRARSRRPTGTY
jgi:hypothetical protein